NPTKKPKSTPYLGDTQPAIVEHHPDLGNPNLFGKTHPIGTPSSPTTLPADAPAYIIDLFQLVQAQNNRLNQLEALLAENTKLKSENEQLKKRIHFLQREKRSAPALVVDDDANNMILDIPTREPNDFSFKLPCHTQIPSDIPSSDASFRTTQGSQASKYATVPAATPNTTTTTKMTPYQAAAHRGLKASTTAKKSSMKKPNPAARRAAARSFQAESANQGFQYIYLPSRVREPLSVVRSKLSKLNIDTSRILDIQFPAKKIVGLLVHNDYAPTIRNRFRKARLITIDDFDPLSANVLHLPEPCSLSDTEKTAKAREYHLNRCLHALDFIRKPVSFAVAKTFLANSWITDDHLKQLVAGTPFFDKDSIALPRTQQIDISRTTSSSSPTTDDVEMTPHDNANISTPAAILPSGAGELASQQ
ncbi:hypothetical protein BDF20DRAFT_843074, partial [Mycotypha africana]|uniref:uncharacterized protein n=1 Tax=Mycotypha africana TaxID=64632 RepID=UPI002301AA8D